MSRRGRVVVRQDVRLQFWIRLRRHLREDRLAVCGRPARYPLRARIRGHLANQRRGRARLARAVHACAHDAQLILNLRLRILPATLLRQLLRQNSLILVWVLVNVKLPVEQVGGQFESGFMCRRAM